MPSGYSGTPLVKKLGLKEGARGSVLDAPCDYSDLLGGLPKGVELTDTPVPGSDFIHFFVCQKRALTQRLPQLKRCLARDGALWLSWPKRTSKIPGDLSGNVVRACGLAIGLVDVKVCAVDENWSGLKFVYRLKDR